MNDAISHAYYLIGGNSMISLLKKYKQWLACFLAGFMCVILSSAVFAQQAPSVSGFSSEEIGNTALNPSAPVDYVGFVESHLEANFYGDQVVPLNN